MKYEQELDEKTNLIDKLKQQNELTKNQNEIIKKENDKILEKIEIQKKTNKQADYNKKMASLNLELALTQDIYETLMKAKSTYHAPNLNLADSLVHVENSESSPAQSPREPTFPGLKQVESPRGDATPAFGNNMLMSFAGQRR